ncbi:MAG: DUF2946 family protein [Hyphomicrobium sp.]
MLRRLLSLLFVLALAVRGLVPTGYMLSPAADGSGEMTIVVCTGHGPLLMTIDADGNPVPPAKPAASDTGLCAFAASAAVAVAPPLPPVSMPAVNVTFVATGVPHAPRLPGTRNELPLPARGPPSIS